MKSNIFGRIGLSALSLLILAGMVISLAPTAQAQAFTPVLELSVKSQPSVALVPNGAPQPIVVHYKYQFREVTSTVPNVVTTSTTIHFDPPAACNGVGFIITGPPSSTITFGSGAEQTKAAYEADVTFSVIATQDAPGETPTECTFRAYSDKMNDQIGPATATAVKATVTAAYLGLISATVPVSIDEAGPQKQIDYVIDILNLGNARSKIVFNIVDTRTNDGWNPVAPNEFVLESALQGGTTKSKTAHFLVSTPYKNGWNNKETTFVLKIQPVSTFSQDNKGSEVSVNVLARVRGIYVPGPEPILMVGALLGAALLLRLRKE